MSFAKTYKIASSQSQSPYACSCCLSAIYSTLRSVAIVIRSKRMIITPPLPLATKSCLADCYRKQRVALLNLQQFHPKVLVQPNAFCFTSVCG